MKPLLSNIYKQIIPKLYGTGLSRIKLLDRINRKIRAAVKPETIDFYGNTIFLDNYDMNQVFVHGESGKDSVEIAFIKNKINERDFVIDVGANIGLYTVMFSNWVGKDGHVWSFEPAQDNCKLIKKTINVNKMDNVKIIQKAVTNFTGETFLNIDGDCSSYHISEKSTKTVPIKCVKLDDCNDKKIDFVKIDAEGQELNVLKGMPKLLQQPNIKLMFEFEPETFSDENNPIEILEILEQNNFFFTDLARKGGIKNITKKELLTRTEKRPELYKNVYCEKLTKN